MSDDTNMAPERHSHDHHGGQHNGRRPRLTGWILTMLTALVVVVVGFVGVVLGHSKTSARSTITVTGSGTVHGTPDTINFEIGVSTVNPTASAALTENNSRMRALEAALAAHGVTKKEMQTSGLNIYDNTNDQGTVTGFTVEDTLNVTMHRVRSAGGAIDAAARAAGNGIELNGVTFTITNDSSLLRAARIRAMKNAHLAASQLVNAGDAHITGIVKITDNENQSSGVYYPTFSSSALKAGVPLQTGSQPINVLVTVTYSLAS
jgi:uncharacterized protein YggE